MYVKLNDGREIAVNWMWLIERTGELIMQINDERPLSQIAADWEGIEVMERISEAEGDKIYRGYTRIKRLIRKDDHGANCVEIVFTKGA